MATLAVAALSARSLVEAAVSAGHEALALDLFGDIDTCRAARRWWRIGDPAALHIEAGPFCDALRQAAANGASGWIAGSGFEADPALLDAGATLLPLLGNPASAWQQVADPQRFFGCLSRHGVPHPPWSWQRPPAAEDWLHKPVGRCGGWGVQAATAVAGPAAGGYFQRRSPGRPVSATFVADGRSAMVLGFNQQRLQAAPGRPYGFAGIVGPVVLAAPAAAEMRRALALLVAEFGLVGLGSLDALLEGERLAVLELNPRPPASHALYEPQAFAAHLAACRTAVLPPAPDAAPGVQGQAIVYARHSLQVDAALAALLAEWPDSHDLPPPGTAVAAGDPLCSLGAQGPDAGTVQARLDAAIEQLWSSLDRRNRLPDTALERHPP